MTHLLDSNVLVALVMTDHVHHAVARDWLRAGAEPVASCPITQGALVRTMLRTGATVDDVHRALAALLAGPRHEFWPDDIDYRDVALTGVIGHRQVTDAYLVALADAHGARLATFDKGIGALHPDVADLLTP